MENRQIIDYLNASPNEMNIAFAWLRENMKAAITAFIFNTGGTPEEAEDVLQEGLIEILRRARMGKIGEEDHVPGLLFRICKNKWYTLVTRKQKRTDIFREIVATNGQQHKEELPSPVDPVRITESLTEILTEYGHQLLVDRYLKGMNEETICEQRKMGSVASVRSTLSNARKKMRQKLAEDPALAEYVRVLIDTHFREKGQGLN